MELRSLLRELLPDAQECMSYSMPGYRLNGKMVAGFAAFKNHVGFYPHSGQVFKDMLDDITDFSLSAQGGGLHLPLHAELPRDLIAKAVAIRIRQAFESSEP